MSNVCAGITVYTKTDADALEFRANIKSEMRSFKSNENIHKKEGGSYSYQVFISFHFNLVKSVALTLITDNRKMVVDRAMMLGIQYRGIQLR